jgi:phage-related minor tail protein
VAIGRAFVDVAFNPSQIDGALGGLQGRLGGRFGAIGKGAGLAMKAGLVAGAAAAVVGVGKALYGIGEQFDEMEDTIRTTTGKSGKALDGLTQTARKVGTTVPTSFADAGKAVAELNVRTGATGGTLRTMSAQMLELTRLTGGDLSSNIASATRLFGDWGLSGREASSSLDLLFRTTQATGVPVDRLSQLLVKFGAPLRQLGFGFEESAVMLGKFEKEGVNTELVMGSMRIALGKLAKAGKDPQKEFAKTVEAIKNAGSASEANAKAIELFGARAGPDMAAAIREGRFSVEELLRTVKGGKETILGAARDTRDFSENWQIFKNQVAVALAPIATRLFDALGRGMAWANTNAGPLIARLRAELGPALQQVMGVVRELEPVFRFVFNAIRAQIEILLTIWQTVYNVVAPVVQAIGALLRGDWSAAWEHAKEAVTALVTGVREIVAAMLNYLRTIWAPIGQAALALGRAILDGVITGAQALGARILDLLRAGVAAVTGMISTATNAARNFGLGILNGVRNGLAALASTITGLVRAGVNAVLGLVGAAISAASAVGRGIITGVNRGLAGLVTTVQGWFQRLWAWIAGAADSAAAFAFAIGAAIPRGIWNGISSGAGWLYGQVKSFVGGIKDAATFWDSPPEAFGYKVGRRFLEGLVLGIRTLTPAVEKAAGDAVTAAIRAAQQKIEAARGAFADAFGGLSSELLKAFDAMIGGAKTKSEKLIEQMELDRRIAEMRERITDARAELAEAKAAAAGLTQGADETPEAFAARQKAANDAVVQAQKALDEALYQQRLFELQRKAEQERKERDAQVALKRKHFEQDLAELQAKLAREGATQEQATNAILALMRKYGIKYDEAARVLGKAFVVGLKEELAEAVREAQRVANKIRRALESAWRAASGPGAGGDDDDGPSGLVPPIGPVTAGPLGFTAPAAAAPLGLGGGGGIAGPVSPTRAIARQLARVAPTGGDGASVADLLESLSVRVYIGDRELTDLVRTEVVAHDEGVTRSLVAAGVS